MIPVYVINGFLDSGKSEFINYTLDQPYFQAGGKTLLLLCEEGEVSYSADIIKRSHTIIELIEDEEDFTPTKMIELEKKYKPARILIEFNGMWNAKDLKLPWHWKIEQQITCIDGSTFEVYFANMKSLLAEMLRKSEMIIMNRCDGILDKLASYKRNIKAVNQQAEIIFEDSNGEINATLEEDLPFDVKASLIELDDNGYGVWYIDMLDNMQRYIGKTVKFLAMVLHPKQFPAGYFVPGRMAMTCCADDMTFLGYACKYEAESSLNQKEWILVTAEVKWEYFEDYKSEGPILYAKQVEKAKAPKETIISFV